MIRKVCPIVLRNTNGQLQFLAFEHPLAGRQLVKGTIEPGESDASAARRELEEESGLVIDLQNMKLIGASKQIVPGHEWVFFETLVSDLSDSWIFKCKDDGGQIFRFFWQDAGTPLDERWHESFHAALGFYKSQRTVTRKLNT